jgi:ABC-type dipeptide/oligopeptide/nickel transport system ATPase component
MNLDNIVKIKKNTVFNKTTFYENFEINKGDIVHIYGNPQSGKTTFVNMIYNLITGRYIHDTIESNKIFQDAAVLFLPLGRGMDELNFVSIPLIEVLIFECLPGTLPVNFLKKVKEEKITVIFTTSLINYKLVGSKELKLGL